MRFTISPCTSQGDTVFLIDDEMCRRDRSKLGAYDGNEEYIRAVVMDKLYSRLDAAKGARRNDIGLVLRHIPDGAYIPNRSASVAVSYTHLDVYKRQRMMWPRFMLPGIWD